MDNASHKAARKPRLAVRSRTKLRGIDLTELQRFGALKPRGPRRQEHGKSNGRLQARLNGQSRRITTLLVFACNFLKHPTKVGWLLPSSQFLVDEVLRQVDWARARVIVEYGPGVGTFTQRVLEQMHPDARLVAFEINPDFIEVLQTTVKDPRFTLVSESAAEVDAVLKDLGLAQADYVISGIPFRTLPHALRDVIVRKTYSVLKPQGHFLIYQLSGAVLPYLEQVFGNVSRRVELRNLLPTRLFYCAR